MAIDQYVLRGGKLSLSWIRMPRSNVPEKAENPMAAMSQIVARILAWVVEATGVLKTRDPSDVGGGIVKRPEQVDFGAQK